MRPDSEYTIEAHARRLEEASEREAAEAEAGNFRNILGESFDPYDTEANHKRLGNFIESMRWPVSSKSMLAAFSILLSRGVLETIHTAPEREEPASEPVEQPRDARGRYTSADPDKEFREFYDGSSATKIKARSQSDPEFEKWLRREVHRNTAHQSLPPAEPTQPVVLPEPPPTELRAFAERFHKMPAAEVKKQLGNADFVRLMDSAASHGLI